MYVNISQTQKMKRKSIWGKTIVQFTKVRNFTYEQIAERAADERYWSKKIWDEVWNVGIEDAVDPIKIETEQPLRLTKEAE